MVFRKFFLAFLSAFLIFTPSAGLCEDIDEDALEALAEQIVSETYVDESTVFFPPMGGVIDDAPAAGTCSEAISLASMLAASIDDSSCEDCCEREGQEKYWRVFIKIICTQGMDGDGEPQWYYEVPMRDVREDFCDDPSDEDIAEACKKIKETPAGGGQTFEEKAEEAVRERVIKPKCPDGEEGKAQLEKIKKQCFNELGKKEFGSNFLGWPNWPRDRKEREEAQEKIRKKCDKVAPDCKTWRDGFDCRAECGTEEVPCPDKKGSD